MKIVIIAEKPSVAREIASIVGATKREDGFIEGNNYLVTWAFGHLIQLAMPEQYGAVGFNRTNLPILPQDFILIPRQVKADKGYKADSGALKQLKVIEKLFNQCDKIIVVSLGRVQIPTLAMICSRYIENKNFASAKYWQH